jgi:4-hydroxybenzoate polyprenyltransferase
MLAYFKLIRLPNLLIMAFTQYMVRYCLLMPVLELKCHDLDFSLLESQISNLDFFLLVLSTVFIGAAGYIINDYFDVRIDEVNRPATNLVGKIIKRRVAIALHTVFNVIGVGLGLWLSWKYNMFRLGSLIYLSTPALLWFYSTNLKRQFLIGNIVIALLSGIVPLIVVLFEIPAIFRAFPAFLGILRLDDVLKIAAIFGLFAFIISLLREIIKDTEDYEGDLAYGCNTLPITIGIARTKWLMLGICVLVIGLIGYVQYNQTSALTTITINVKENMVGIPVALIDTLDGSRFETKTNPSGQAVLNVPAGRVYKTDIDQLKHRLFTSNEADPNWTSACYLFFLIQLPLLFLAWKIHTAKGKKDWSSASTITKFIMVAGISYLFLYAYQIHQLLAADAG